VGPCVAVAVADHVNVNEVATRRCDLTAVAPSGSEPMALLGGSAGGADCAAAAPDV